MATYKATLDAALFIRTADGAAIPLIPLDQPQTGDSAALRAWFAAGNVADPAQTLTDIKAAKFAALAIACAAQIVGGFQSSALGAAHNYPSDPTSQTNMLGSVMASLFPGLAGDWSTPFWCQTTDTHVWAFVAHTAAQIQQVGQDEKLLVVDCQARLATLQAQVAAAADAATVAAIVW